MRSVSILLCTVTVIFCLEINNAANLIREIQQEVETNPTPEYSRKDVTENLEALRKLSRDLNITESGIKTRLKYLEKIKQDLYLVQTFKKGVDELLNRLSPDNTILSDAETNEETGSSKKKKYFILNMNDKVSWSTAKRLCEEKGMQFASIMNEEEERELEATIGLLDTEFEAVWIGASNTEPEESDTVKYVWSSSGLPLSYAKMTELMLFGQCLQVRNIPGNGCEWYTWPCITEYPYACEYW